MFGFVHAPSTSVVADLILGQTSGRKLIGRISSGGSVWVPLWVCQNIFKNYSLSEWMAPNKSKLYVHHYNGLPKKLKAHELRK